jgi:hypothetical protein
MPHVARACSRAGRTRLLGPSLSALYGYAIGRPRMQRANRVRQRLHLHTRRFCERCGAAAAPARPLKAAACAAPLPVLAAPRGHALWQPVRA